MRKVIFTESQIKKYLSEEVGDYLDSIKNAGEIPGNAYGTQVFVNNLDADIENDVTDTDNFMQKRSKGNRLFAKSRQCEGKEFDNIKSSGFGVNSDKKVNAISKNGGKMIKNVNSEINSNKDSMRNGTQYMRLSRMEDYKENDPELYQKNGGDFMVNQLKKDINKNKNIRNAQTGGKREREITPSVSSGTNSHPKTGNNDNIYYYSY